MKKCIVLIFLVLVIPISPLFSEGLSIKNQNPMEESQQESKRDIYFPETGKNENSSLILQKKDFLKIADELEDLNVSVISLSSLDMFIIKGDKNTIKTLGKSPNIKKFTNHRWQGFPSKSEIGKIVKNNGNNIVDVENPFKTISADHLNTTGQNTTIAILDTGIDFDHPMFYSRVIDSVSFVSIINEYSFTEESVNDLNGHGTHVAGIAAGSKLYDYSGIAFEASLINIKIGSETGEVTTEGLLMGIDYAIQKQVDVISMSIGFNYDDPDDVISLAVDYAVAQGISVVISAGNEGPDKYTINTPATARLPIAVGAYDSKLESVAEFSSTGPTEDKRIKPDIIAPGVDIYSLLSRNSIMANASNYYTDTGVKNHFYYPLSGTSMATPVVAGAIALLKESFPNLNPLAIKSALMSSADHIAEIHEFNQGSGLINVSKAYTILNNTLFPDKNSTSANITFSTPNYTPIVDFEVPKILFPQESYNYKVIILSGDNLILDYDLKGNISDILQIESSYQNSSGKGTYYEYNIIIKSDLNPVFGNYNGSIIFFNNITNMTIKEENFHFSLIVPVKKLYWDHFHTTESNFANNTHGEFSLIEKIIRKKSIQIITKETPIRIHELLHYDILILFNSQYTFLDEEIYAIKEFIKSGKDVVILGSHIQLTATNLFNNLLKDYNIQFLEESNVIYEDYWPNDNIFSEPFSLYWNNISLFDQVNNLTSIATTYLDSIESSTTKIIARSTINNKAVMKLYTGNSGGKIFVSGDNLLFRDQFNKISNDSLILADNLFQDLVIHNDSGLKFKSLHNISDFHSEAINVNYTFSNFFTINNSINNPLDHINVTYHIREANRTSLNIKIPLINNSYTFTFTFNQTTDLTFSYEDPLNNNTFTEYSYVIYKARRIYWPNFERDNCDYQGNWNEIAYCDVVPTISYRLNFTAAFSSFPSSYYEFYHYQDYNSVYDQENLHNNMYETYTPEYDGRNFYRLRVNHRYPRTSALFVIRSQGITDHLKYVPEFQLFYINYDHSRKDQYYDYENIGYYWSRLDDKSLDDHLYDYYVNDKIFTIWPTKKLNISLRVDTNYDSYDPFTFYAQILPYYPFLDNGMIFHQEEQQIYDDYPKRNHFIEYIIPNITEYNIKENLDVDAQPLYLLFVLRDFFGFYETYILPVRYTNIIPPIITTTIPISSTTPPTDIETHITPVIEFPEKTKTSNTINRDDPIFTAIYFVILIVIFSSMYGVAIFRNRMKK